MRQRGAKLVLTGIAALAVISAVTMVLWNHLMPAIFGLTAITFWQAAGLLALCRILFGRFGWNGMMMRGRENHIREKWMKMTPEQRREFITKRRNFGYPFGAGYPGQAEHGDGER